MTSEIQSKFLRSNWKAPEFIPGIRLFWNKGFLHYAWVSGLFSAVNVFFLWLLIDVFAIPTVLASVIVVGGTFLLRYLVFQIFKVM